LLSDNLRTCQIAKHRREGLDIAYAHFDIATPPEDQTARNAWSARRIPLRASSGGCPRRSGA